MGQQLYNADTFTFYMEISTRKIYLLRQFISENTKILNKKKNEETKEENRDRDKWLLLRNLPKRVKHSYKL